MRLIGKIHLEYPFLGSRGIRNELWNKGYKVGRNHIRTLMKKRSPHEQETKELTIMTPVQS